jgi:hypothetical protein
MIISKHENIGNKENKNIGKTSTYLKKITLALVVVVPLFCHTLSLTSLLHGEALLTATNDGIQNDSISMSYHFLMLSFEDVIC